MGAQAPKYGDIKMKTLNEKIKNLKKAKTKLDINKALYDLNWSKKWISTDFKKKFHLHAKKRCLESFEK